MRVCLLTPQVLDADPFPDDDWPCDPRPFLPEAEWTVATLRKATAGKRLIGLARQGFDVFFNLCDGAWDEASPGIEVVQTLERLNLPFTGATSAFFEPSRELMKRVCRAHGLHAPAHVMATQVQDLERALDTLRFPMFVKHPSSYASVGLTRTSRVATAAELRREARRILRAYGGALIEEFVEGREFTVLVAEHPNRDEAPTTYKPLEYRFPKGECFKHSDLKWLDYDSMSVFPVRDRALGARLRDCAARFFLGMNGSGYGRCDIRMDRDGRLFLLEINANCGLYYPPKDASGADYILLKDPAGHVGFTRQIVAAALARHGRAQPPWEVRPGRSGVDGVHATRSLRKGELAVALGDGPRRLVSSSPLRRKSGAPGPAMLRRLAWPIGEGLWLDWGRDASSWRPVAHSCQPNTWLKGMDLVARRPIERGEEVTVDYATIHDESLPAFRCDCGAARCRGRIKGTDYLEAFVAGYGRNVSPHIKARRERLASD